LLDGSSDHLPLALVACAEHLHPDGQTTGRASDIRSRESAERWSAQIAPAPFLFVVRAGAEAGEFLNNFAGAGDET
jgi:hypothetical protein